MLVSHLVLLHPRRTAGLFVSPKNQLQFQLQHKTHHRRNIRSLSQKCGSSSSSNNDSTSESTANTLREKADQLRREITQFEDGKRDKERSDQLARDNLFEKKRDERLQYSTIIPILKGDGSTEMERVDFKPRFKASTSDGMPSSSSVILAVQAALPLGIILGEDETFPGAIRVDELVENGNAAASGVMVGDLLRACTACQVTMEMPTWQIMAGGIGRPKTNRMMFSTDGRPFEEVMEAVGSNRIDPEKRPAWLVLERKEESDE